MRLLAGIAGLAIATFVMPAWAAEQTTTSEPNDPNEVICKVVPGDTGSRLNRRRECHTWREWEERRRQDRQMTEETQMRDSRGVAPP
jgi:3-phenylpropionate/cinnamic acid dioxygenase small subunit